MNRYIVIALIYLSGLSGVANALEQPPTAIQESKTPDYKNRPDPCELKQKQKSGDAGAANPTKKPTESVKR